MSEPVSTSAIASKGPTFEELARALGQVFNNGFLYGADHGVTKKAMEDCYNILIRLFDYQSELLFNVTEEGLLVNGAVVEQKNPLVRTFISHLAKLEIKSFGLEKGMPRDKFDKLIEIMNTKPDILKQSGGFTSVVAGHGLQGVRVSKVSYVQIAEDELVVSKKDLAAAAAAAGAGSENRSGTIDGVFAFLKGEKAEEDATAGESVRELASHPKELADAVLQSARARKDAAGTGITQGGGESVSDFVVENIKKVYNSLMKDPAAKTQKGKKEIEKELELLEERILTKLHEATGEADESGASKVTEAVEGMLDELRIEALAAEYMKKRKAIEVSEKRILRFIKVKGLDKIEETELQDKLVAGGLSSEEWTSLLSKTGVGTTEDASTIVGQNIDSMVMLGHLSNLLTEMESAVKQGVGTAAARDEKHDNKNISGVLKEVSSELGTIVATTEQKIDNLVKDLRADAEAEASGGADGGNKARMPRRKLMEVLAEIGQELCQPLAVINCTLGLVVSESIGEVTADQREMLNLAISSEEKLKLLADRLMELSGVPTTLSPDAKIQSSLYAQ